MYFCVPEWSSPFTPPGDLDKDGDINLSDFATFAFAWLTKPEDLHWNTYCGLSVPAGTIDMLDLSTFIENWMTDIK